jgi:MFS family permease
MHSTSFESSLGVCGYPVSFPAFSSHLSTLVPRGEDRAKACAMFMIAIPVANIIGSPLGGWLSSSLVRFAGMALALSSKVFPRSFWHHHGFYLTDWPREARWFRTRTRLDHRRVRQEAPAKKATRSRKSGKPCASLRSFA